MGFNERTIAGVTVLDLDGRLTFTSGAEMGLLNPTERTRQLLEITGLVKIVEMFDSEAAALASYGTAEDKHVISSALEC